MLFAFHDTGDPAGGAAWRAALAGGEAGPFDAPDLPGHGAAPMPEGGSYELGDVAIAAAPQLAEDDGQRRCVLGVGTSGWSAWLLACGGLAEALVLVDGLGGPYADVGERVAGSIARRRAIVADPDATAWPEPGSIDPRAVHGVDPMARLDFALRFATSCPVPVLVVRSPDSPTGAADAGALIQAFPEVTSVRTRSADPTVVVPVVAAWWSPRR